MDKFKKVIIVSGMMDGKPNQISKGEGAIKSDKQSFHSVFLFYGFWDMTGLTA